MRAIETDRLVIRNFGPDDWRDLHMILLTTNLSDPLLELLRHGQVPLDGVEVGPWFSVRQIREYRRALPGLPFYFHGGDLIDRVGLIPGAVSKIAAYRDSTGSPWVSMHITTWWPGMVWLMLRRGWRMPLPDPEAATQRFIRRVKKLARALRVPVTLEYIREREALREQLCDLCTVLESHNVSS